MNGLPPVNLADAFTTKPAGLTGVLPPRPKKPADEKPVVTKTGPQPAAERASTKRPRNRQPAKPASHRLRGVIVYVTPEQRDWIRERISSIRTVTDVVLDAIEVHQAHLAPPTPDAPPSGGLFARHKTKRQDLVQLQLRTPQANVDVLDAITADHAFPSRSALVRAALQAATQNH